MKRLWIILSLMLPSWGMASGPVELPYHIEVDIHNQEGLRRGFSAFVENCLGCHGTQYQRYNRVGQDLGITQEDMKDKFMPLASTKIGEHIKTAMSKQESKQWFGVQPPDLTLVARVRGASWIYSYLKSFYIDETKLFGVNNTVFETVAMPHVLEKYQGRPEPIYDKEGHLEKIVVQGGTLSAEAYDQLVHDITNFLVYSAEPIRSEREHIGMWVLMFLLVFSGVSWLLKREYWKDVH
jgi:ubiquinol-cytochrome c reductase cytochrome c1 subunit